MKLPALFAALSFWATGVLQAGTATGISGLYYTGVSDSGGLLSATSQDSHWTVSYAYANGISGNSSYEGNAYVVSSKYIDSAWAPNTSTAQWIVPPGASTSTSGQSINAGGVYLPGNGTSGSNSASYVYTLAFNISGTGTGTATNQISISLTLAADDQAKVYINPTYTNSGAVSSSSTLGGSLSSAWANTTSLTLKNYGTDANASFVIGTNYLVIQVDNTNSLTGTQYYNSARNPSGLLLYQTSSMAVIDGKPVPEVGTYAVVLAAAALYGARRFRATRKPVSVA